MNSTIKPIKVTATLKNSTYLQNDKWLCRFKNESLIVNRPIVEVYTLSFIEGMGLFNPEDVDCLTIERTIKNP